jgi:dihydropteroate synthase
MLNSRVEITHFPVKKTLRSGDRLIDISQPLIMGILNATPDSFYAKSRISQETAVLDCAEKMILSGATILDIGGYSTRPGAKELSSEEECKRTIPLVRSIKKAFPDVLLSLDTFRPEVAQQGLEEGVDIINDVTGGQYDENIWKVLEKYRPIYVVMHSNGKPFRFHDSLDNEILFSELISFFSQQIERLRSIGIHDILLDPGFGFSKSLKDNYHLLNELPSLRCLGHPILAGLSRKSMITKLLECTAEEALNGTTVLNTVALLQGASVLRVHDVRAAAEILTLLKQ